MTKSNTIDKKLDVIIATMVTMVTKENLKNELKNFATKDDLKTLATKKDLEAFATKADFEMLSEDLDNLAIATQNNFALMVTKEEFGEKMIQIDYRLDRIDNISFGGHDRRIENLEDDMRMVKTKVKLKK